MTNTPPVTQTPGQAPTSTAQRASIRPDMLTDAAHNVCISAPILIQTERQTNPSPDMPGASSICHTQATSAQQHTAFNPMACLLSHGGSHSDRCLTQNGAIRSRLEHTFLPYHASSARARSHESRPVRTGYNGQSTFSTHTAQGSHFSGLQEWEWFCTTALPLASGNTPYTRVRRMGKAVEAGAACTKPSELLHARQCSAVLNISTYCHPSPSVHFAPTATSTPSPTLQQHSGCLTNITPTIWQYYNQPAVARSHTETGAAMGFNLCTRPLR